MKNIRKVVMVIIGTLIGAGFASGKEIYMFFFVFGKMGILGIIISSILTGLTIYFTLNITTKQEIDNYNELLENVNNNHIKIKKVLKSIVNVFLLISFYIMVAGFGAYIYQEYKIPTYISCSIFVIIIYFILNKDIKGILSINNILVPIIIILIIFLGLKNSQNLINSNLFQAPVKQYIPVFYSILYTSYNSIILIPVIISLKNYIQKKSDIMNISILSSLCIAILATCIFCILSKSQIDISGIDMPIIELVSDYGLIIKKIYGIVIIISIFTSAVSVGYSFIKNVSNEKNYKKHLLLVIFSSIFVSNIGFTNLVNILYPLFGIIGIFQLIFIYIKSLEKK